MTFYKKRPEVQMYAQYEAVTLLVVFFYDVSSDECWLASFAR